MRCAVISATWLMLPVPKPHAERLALEHYDKRRTVSLLVLLPALRIGYPVQAWRRRGLGYAAVHLSAMKLGLSVEEAAVK